MARLRLPQSSDAQCFHGRLLSNLRQSPHSLCLHSQVQTASVGSFDDGVDRHVSRDVARVTAKTHRSLISAPFAIDSLGAVRDPIIAP
jgi:hypothetical protein